MKDIIIIGAGASGLVVAKELAKTNRFNIKVLEQNNKLGKKLLATGNGRCNISNDNIDFKEYNFLPSFLKEIIESFDSKEYFNKLGMLTKNIGNLVYPYSFSSKTVLDILISPNVDYSLDTKVINVYRENHKYQVVTNKGTYIGDRVVLALGSKASFLSGDDNEKLIKQLNLKLATIKPGLVAFNTKQVYPEINGVRQKARVSLVNNQKEHYVQVGEVLFTKYGLSGICIMQLSRHYQLNDKIVVDLLPEYTNDAFQRLSKERIDKYGDIFYEGIFVDKLAKLLRTKKLNPKKLVFDIASLGDFSKAQVCQGGLDLSEIDYNLELFKYPGMYACGEILDVDGTCGGYNLHFAFASGNKVAQAIIEKEK